MINALVIVSTLIAVAFTGRWIHTMVNSPNLDR